MEKFYNSLVSGKCPGDFLEYCRKSFIIPCILDEVLVKETGFTGQEIIDSWQNSICIRNKFY